jgi:hypothetical protein
VLLPPATRQIPQQVDIRLEIVHDRWSGSSPGESKALTPCTGGGTQRTGSSSRRNRHPALFLQPLPRTQQMFTLQMLLLSWTPLLYRAHGGLRVLAGVRVLTCDPMHGPQEPEAERIFEPFDQ